MKRYYNMRPSLQLRDDPEVDKESDSRKNNNDHVNVAVPTTEMISPDAKVQAMSSSRIGRESSKVEVESLALMMRSTNEAISNVRVLLSTMKGLRIDDVAGTNDKGGITYDIVNIMSEEEDEKEPVEQPTWTINGKDEGPNVESIEDLVTSDVTLEFIDKNENENDMLSSSTRTEIGKEGLDVVCPEDVVPSNVNAESEDEKENVVIVDEPTSTTTGSEKKEVSDVKIKDEVVTSNVIVEPQDEKENIITEPACTRIEIVNEGLNVEIPEGVVLTSNGSGAESEDEKENVCIQSPPITKSNLQPSIPSYVKLKPSVRDRIKEIDNVRILLEYEQEKETDVVLQLSNKLKKVRDDVDCKRQENFYLLKVIEDLKNKNSEYAQQIDQLTLIADELVDCKGDSMQRIETLEDELTMRQTVIDEITVALEQKSEENVQLNEELTHIKAKNDEFKTEVRTLVNLTKENVQHITTLEGGLMAKKMMIDKLTVSLEQKTTENAFLTDRVEHYKVKHDGLKTVIKDLVISNKENINAIGMLEDKLASKMSTINEMKQNLDALTSTCEEMKIENAKLNEKLAHSQAESDKFKSKVETLVVRTQERRSVLEADLADKQDTIDKMSAEILETQALCEERAAENIELIEQLQHHQITIDQYKTSNTKLLDVVERITQQFNDEKARHETEMDELVTKLGSSYEKEIEGMKDVLDAEKEDVIKKAQEDVNLIKIEMSSQISVLNETLEESTVELKKAMLDIQRKNTLLDEKNTEINDLTEQLQLVKAKNALQVQVTNKKKADNVNLEKQLQLAQAKVITLYDQLANNATIECSNNGRHNKSTMTQDHDTNFVSSNASELESMMSSLQQHVVGLQYQPTYE